MNRVLTAEQLGQSGFETVRFAPCIDPNREKIEQREEWKANMRAALEELGLDIIREPDMEGDIVTATIIQTEDPNDRLGEALFNHFGAEYRNVTGPGRAPGGRCGN